MVREFKFFRGYVDKTITINTPTWVINPNPMHLYTPQPYTITTTPSNYGTITIPNNYNGFTTGTATTSTLTTSNPNGITYTTGGFGGTLTTGTATYSSSSFKLQ